MPEYPATVIPAHTLTDIAGTFVKTGRVGEFL